MTTAPRRFLPLAVALLAATGAATASAQTIHHSLDVELEPATHRLRVRAEITAPADALAEGFLLAAPLRIERATPAVEEVAGGTSAGSTGSPVGNGRRVRHYRLAGGPSFDGRLRIEYAGAIDYPLSNQEEEYTRGFRETAGSIGGQGVYLAGSSPWYPRFGDRLVTFDLRARAPEGWHLVAAGEGTSRDADGRARWTTRTPVDEIHLAGGPLRVWRDAAGAVETAVYLHEADEALARKYLAATAQYLGMYGALVGPYPYAKFALVENFWETGYGMPSFTLLGPTVVRFPWILTSSYPHEILHNWWGNGVFVDYARGNWSEGLTAYLADHLVQEQRGRAHEYRRATLQKYRNHVKDERDFPLVEFRGRESASTEAVGYGRTLMGFHMLRRQLGDESFERFLGTFYREHRGRRASFADVQRVAESIAGRPLEGFFRDWITRPGAPELELHVSPIRREAGEFVVEGTLRQRQADAPFALDVPLVVQAADGSVLERSVPMTGREARFHFALPREPIAVVADPRFDLFRRLDPRETPTSIGQIFGEPRVTAVLPAGASPEAQAAYRALVGAWQGANHHIDVVTDSTLRDLPADRPVWLLGRENTLATRLFGSAPGVGVSSAELALGPDVMRWREHTAVVTTRHPANGELAVGWIVADPLAALPGLARKLPHYGRYSYVGFEGEEPTNTIKGEWPATGSPLLVDLRTAAARRAPLPPLSLPPSKALADLPPTFSSSALREHVAWLAAPERNGRGLGSSGLAAAADYVARAFATAGLTPGVADGGWLQHFRVERGPGGQPVDAANVVGVLPGTDPAFDRQWVLVSAHYDHLGTGWPDAHAGDAGALHPGADDNASGVAVLLELARAAATHDERPRTIVFAAFSAEEAGLAGSRHFADHPTPLPLSGLRAVVNLDTVGRLGTGRVSILGADSAAEWPHIFRGGSYVTGVDSVSVAGNAEGSDQRVFLERGIPAVQIFTGPHADYHRPGDTPEKVDVAGLVKVATLVKEAVDYLAARPEPLTATGSRAATAPSDDGTASGGPAAPGPVPATPAAGAGRRVAFGAVPDFAFGGPGVRLEGVTPGSPAEAAGLRAGDVITRLNDQAVESLRAFSELLRALAPGDRVAVTFARDGTERTASVTVVAR